MLVTLDLITQKKLILVKQIYQRALIQSQFTHRIVDRMLAIVGFDFANETVLKAIAVALNNTIALERNFPKVINQVNVELNNKNEPSLDTTKIQHVHDVRNATQHHARYPTEIEVSDSRTYTRDFLVSTFFDIWAASFELISLVDAIQNDISKKRLKEAETDLENGDFREVMTKSKATFDIMIFDLASSITKGFSPYVRSFVITDSFDKTESNENVFTAFNRMRDLIVYQTIGISPQEYLKFLRFTRFIGIHIMADESYSVNFSTNKIPTKEEAEFVLNFVINSIIQIENLDDDILKAHNSFD